MTLTNLPERDGTADRQFRGAAGRWQPTRAGLIRVWQYAEETFEFENGRLVLFGANGSGKTMALELLFPYLLDANASPSRLSTAGGNERGGLWNRVSGYEDNAGRVGYLWAEFTRTTSGGQTEHFTCGTRLAAKPGGGGNHCWFTTHQRIGTDLSLLGENRIALTPQALRDQIGTEGTVWGDDSVGYRKAVRTTLFSEFSADGYASLIDALLAVRKQSITENLNPDALHRLLTDGLPALDGHELEHVARGFEHLDSRRDTIDALRDAVTAGVAIARQVRTYSRTALRAVADRVTTAQSELEKITRKRTEAERALGELTDALEATDAELEELAGTDEQLGVRIDAVKDSVAYRSISELGQERRRVAAMEKQAKDAAELADRRRIERGKAEDKRVAAALELQRAEKDAADTRRKLVVDARTVQIDPGLADSDDGTASRYKDEIRLRDAAVAEVRQLITAHSEAVRDRDGAEERLDDAEQTKASRDGEVRAARSTLSERLGTWAAAVGDWAVGLAELGPPPPAETMLDAVAGPIDDGDVSGPVTVATAAHRHAAGRLARERADLDRELADLNAQIAEAETDRDRLADVGDVLVPFRAPWRNPPDEQRPGAPLWALLTPTGHTPDVLDGIEAALDAAGLLDAWISDDAADRNLAAGDLVAAPLPPSPGPSLADVVAVDDAACTAASVDPATVAAVIASVAVGVNSATDLHVNGDGQFRYGPVHGAAPAHTASFIGVAARERARLAEIARLDGLLVDLRSDAEAVQARIDDNDACTARAQAEAEAVPAGAEVTGAHEALTLAESRAEDADAQVQLARGAFRAADKAATEALGALTRTATTAALPTTAKDLDRVARTLRVLTETANVLEKAAATVGHRQETHTDSVEFEAQRAQDHDDAQEAARIAGTDARNARARFTQLEKSLGPKARKAADDLASLEGERSKIASRRKALTREQGKQQEQKGKADGVLSETKLASETAATVREAAAVQFAAVIAAGVAQAAEVDIGDEDLGTVTGVKNATRAVNRQVTTGGDLQRLTRERGSIEEARFASAKVLAGRADVGINDVPGPDGQPLPIPVSQVVAVVEGVELSAVAMVDRFRAELERAEAEIAAREAELFEQIFTGSLRVHLASRLRAAQHLVDSMNELLAGIRSAAGGVTVSLRWEVADDIEDTDTLRRIKALLLRQQHSAEDSALLHTFLTRRIDQIRDDDRSLLSWRDALEALFDYRRWHRFRVMVRHTRFGDTAIPFTSRKVSLSAGEKALVLSLPLFAAVASHYMPRDEDGDLLACPRLLLLDEVFPKNDRANKRQILGLLTELDLDCVLTSDKDRCNYDTVDGIAIAVIAKDGDLSYSTRLVWNGRELTESAPSGTDGSGQQALV